MSKIIKLNDFRETKIEDLPILGIDELDLCMNEVAFMTMYHEYLNRGGSEEVFKTCQANYISDAMFDEFTRVLGKKKTMKLFKDQAMKVIDKRTEKNNDWNVGDVVCYYNQPDDKNYGMIMAYKCDANNLYILVGIDRNAGNVEVYDSPSIEDLLKEINVYSHVEKVNAKLVIE